MEQAKKFNAGKAWAVAIVITLCQVAFAINMFKVPAVMGQIIGAYGIDPSLAGWLMNAVGITSLILSIPAGVLMQKLGPRNIFIAVFIINIIGDAVGAFAPTFEMLIISRVIEGFAYGLLAATATPFISAWFPAMRRGVPNAISALWVSIGMFVILNSATLVEPVAGWQGVWWFSLAVLVVMFILGLFFLRMPTSSESFLDEGAPQTDRKPSLLEGFKAPAIWLMLLIFLFFGFVTSAYGSYYPLYLQAGLGLPFDQANMVTSVSTITLMVGGIITGIILRKVPIKKRAIMMLVVTLLMVAAALTMFNLPSGSLALPYMVVYGLVMQSFPAVCFTMVPEASRTPATISISMGILMIGMNFSGVFGTLITGMFIVSGGYPSITIPNAIFAVIGVLAAIALIFTMRKKLRGGTDSDG